VRRGHGRSSRLPRSLSCRSRSRTPFSVPPFSPPSGSSPPLSSPRSARSSVPGWRPARRSRRRGSPSGSPRSLAVAGFPVRLDPLRPEVEEAPDETERDLSPRALTLPPWPAAAPAASSAVPVLPPVRSDASPALAECRTCVSTARSTLPRMPQRHRRCQSSISTLGSRCRYWAGSAPEDQASWLD
jgi:hypothetical protein